MTKWNDKVTKWNDKVTKYFCRGIAAFFLVSIVSCNATEQNISDFTNSLKVKKSYAYSVADVGGIQDIFWDEKLGLSIVRKNKIGESVLETKRILNSDGSTWEYRKEGEKQWDYPLLLEETMGPLASPLHTEMKSLEFIFLLGIEKKHSVNNQIERFECIRGTKKDLENNLIIRKMPFEFSNFATEREIWTADFDSNEGFRIMVKSVKSGKVIKDVRYTPIAFSKAIFEKPNNLKPKNMEDLIRDSQGLIPAVPRQE